MKTLYLLFVVCLATSVYGQNWRPVVLMHGIASDAAGMNNVVQWIQADYPGIHILNVEVGNGASDSWVMDINTQVELFTKAVQADPALANGFNLIGYSQGGLITRAYIERTNSPPVHNYISWAGPHDGVYGTPEVNAVCPNNLCPWFDWLMDLLMAGSPSQFVQQHFSFAAYWKNPFDMSGYLAQNDFLADINNEKSINPSYKKNIVSLNTMMLIYALQDEVVIPKVSPWFEFYAPGQDTKVVNFNASAQFSQDLIGLATLYNAGKLHFGSANCQHQDLPNPICKPLIYDAYTRALLNNTL